MQITVHGTPTELLGKDLKVGGEAPAARITKLDGSKNVIGMIAPTAQRLYRHTFGKKGSLLFGRKKV